MRHFLPNEGRGNKNLAAALEFVGHGDWCLTPEKINLKLKDSGWLREQSREKWKEPKRRQLNFSPKRTTPQYDVTSTDKRIAGAQAAVVRCPQLRTSNELTKGYHENKIQSLCTCYLKSPSGARVLKDQPYVHPLLTPHILPPLNLTQ